MPTNPFEDAEPLASESDDAGLTDFSSTSPSKYRPTKPAKQRNWVAIGLGAFLHLGAVVLLALYLMGFFTRTEAPDSGPVKHAVVNEKSSPNPKPAGAPLAARPAGSDVPSMGTRSGDVPKSTTPSPDLKPPPPAGESILWMSEATVTGLRNVAFSGNSKAVICGGNDRAIRIWETESGREVYTMNGYASPGAGVGLSDDSAFFLSTGNEATQIGRVRIPADAMIRARPLEGTKETLVGAHGAKITCLAVGSGGKNALTGSVDQTVRWWDVKAARELKVYKGHKAPVRAVDFSPKHGQCASVDDSGALIVWELMTGRNLGRIDGLTSGVRSFDYSPDGKSILAVDDAGLALLDVPTLKLVKRIMIANDSRISATSACWAPTGTEIVVGIESGVLVVDAETGAKRTALDFPTPVSAGLAPIVAVAISRDGRYVAAAGRSLWIWQLAKPLTAQGQGAESK